MRSCAGLTLSSSRTATQLLPHSPSSKRQDKGRKQIEKSLRVKVKKRRPLSPYCHCHHLPITGQRRVDLGKINLIYCQLKKLWIVRNSNKNIKDHSPTPLLFPKLQLLLHSQHFYSPNPKTSRGRDGEWALQSAQNISAAPSSPFSPPPARIFSMGSHHICSQGYVVFMSFCLTFLLYTHRMTEMLRLEGTSGRHLVEALS